MVSHFWHHLMVLGAQYGVNPLIFAALYLAHHPLFWGTMAWLAARLKAKKPVAAVITLGVFFWLLPYSYVFVFGRGLPWWAYALAAVCLGVSGWHVNKEIQRRRSRFAK